MEQQLIALYLRVRRAYHNQPDLKYQRLSNFRQRFTDEELLIIYLSGHMQGFYQQRRIYDYTRQRWRAWFPHLPSYQAFNRRLNQLALAFEHLITELLAEPVEQLDVCADRMVLRQLDPDIGSGCLIGDKATLAHTYLIRRARLVK